MRARREVSRHLRPRVLAFGSTASTGLGVPLPVDLGIIGAPGCLVQHDNLVSIAGMTSGTLGMYNGRWPCGSNCPTTPSQDSVIKLRLSKRLLVPCTRTARTGRSRDTT